MSSLKKTMVATVTCKDQAAILGLREEAGLYKLESNGRQFGKGSPSLMMTEMLRMLIS